MSGKAGRRSAERPFAGALCAIAGGTEIAVVRLCSPIGSPRTVVPAGLLIAAVIVACGLLLLADPLQRSAYSTVVVLLAILSLTTAHLGGYLAGALLTGAGGAIAFAWVPAPPGPEPPESVPSPEPGPYGVPGVRGPVRPPGR